MTTKSSEQHCLSCLTRLKLAYPSFQAKPEEIAAQMKRYAEALMAFPPQAVKAGCDEWAATQDEWPVLAKLLAIVRKHETAKPAILDETTVAGRICARERRLAAASGLSLTEIINRVSADIMAIIALEDTHRLTDDLLGERIGLHRRQAA